MSRTRAADQPMYETDDEGIAHVPGYGVRVHLDEVLVRRKMSLARLAELTGVHQNNLSRLKNGHVSGIRWSTLMPLCAALQCQPGDLISYGPLPQD